MAQKPITGIPSSWRLPGGYAEILFAQGASSASAGVRTIVHCMPKLAASGTWTAATLYGPIKNEAEAVTGGGAGSSIHRSIRFGMMANPKAKHYALPYLPSSGGGAAASTGVYTIAIGGGGTPTATGTLEGWVGGEYWSCAWTIADTATTLGDKVVAAINAKTWLGCTASNGAGTVTLTAKQMGASSGTATIGSIRLRLGTVTAGTGVSCTVSAAYLGFAPGVAGADGATTEVTNFTAALAAINATRRYYIVSSLTQTADLTPLKTHIVNKSQPNPGLRSVGVFANVQALGAVTTIANALNYERMTCLWQKNSEHDPAELASNWAAALQAKTEIDSAFNFDFYRGDQSCNWLIKAASSTSDWPDGNDQNDAITDGITVAASNDSGSYVVMACSTRSKAAGGTLDDFRATELHRVSVCDFHVDTQLVNFGLTYTSKKLRPDEKLSDGKVNTNQKLAPNVVTPSTFKPFLLKGIDRDYDNGLLKNLVDTKNSIYCEIDPSNGGRIETAYNLYSIDLFHQMTLQVAEASAG
jgi:phage tail sheath gpL-like